MPHQRFTLVTERKDTMPGVRPYAVGDKHPAREGIHLGQQIPAVHQAHVPQESDVTADAIAQPKGHRTQHTRTGVCMKIALVTDAWQPQVNGVVTTLVELCKELTLAGHIVKVIEPGQFATRRCPGYAGIDLAIAPERLLAETLDAFEPGSPSTSPPKARSGGPGAPTVSGASWLSRRPFTPSSRKSSMRR